MPHNGLNIKHETRVLLLQSVTRKKKSDVGRPGFSFLLVWLWEVSDNFMHPDLEFQIFLAKIPEWWDHSFTPWQETVKTWILVLKSSFCEFGVNQEKSLINYMYDILLVIDKEKKVSENLSVVEEKDIKRQKWDEKHEDSVGLKGNKGVLL